jgi:hypothetical protein
LIEKYEKFKTLEMEDKSSVNISSDEENDENFL